MIRFNSVNPKKFIILSDEFTIFLIKTFGNMTNMTRDSSIATIGYFLVFVVAPDNLQLFF